MTSTTLRSGLLIALLITLATTATAVVGGPEPGDGRMAITGHSAATAVSGSAGASRSTGLTEHVSDISLDFRFAGTGTTMPEACGEDLSEAREAAEGQICTQQIANMRCPHDNETVVMAPNGCVISSLEEDGWTRTVEQEPSRDTNASAVTLSGEIVFRTGGYQVQTDSWTEDGTAMFTINVTAPGPNETVTQALTTEQINMTAGSGTYNSAEATVYIDGEQMYSRSETRQTEHVSERPSRPPARPPAQGLTHRVAMLEQRVAALEQQVTLLTEVLQETAPERAEDLEGFEPPETPVEGGTPGRPTGNTSDGQEDEMAGGPPGTPGEQRNTSRGPPGFLDSIRNLFR